MKKWKREVRRLSQKWMCEKQGRILYITRYLFAFPHIYSFCSYHDNFFVVSFSFLHFASLFFRLLFCFLSSRSFHPFPLIPCPLFLYTI